MTSAFQRIYIISVSVTDTIMPWETPSGHDVCFPIPCHQMAVCEIGNEVSCNNFIACDCMIPNSGHLNNKTQ